MTSFLRSCCAGRRHERGLERAGCTGARCVNVPGAGGGVPGLTDVADHQANWSTPAIESGFPSTGEGRAAFVGSMSAGASGGVAAPGSFICPLSAPSRAVFWKEGEDVTAGRGNVTIDDSNCHFPEGIPASSYQLTVGGRLICGSRANCWVLESVALCAASSSVKTRSKAAALLPAHR